MKVKNLTNKVTSKVGRQVLVAQKHSPTLLFGVGVVGVVTTVVLASRATLKMEQVIEGAEKRKAQIQLALDEMENETVKHKLTYTEEDAHKDSITNRVKMAVEIGKLYAPAFVVGVISIGCLTSSHFILTRRNVALTAAYAAADRAFKDYRKRVINELGPEKDEEFRYGVIEKQIAVDTDHGVDVKTVKVVDKNHKSDELYTFLFDRDTSKNWSPTPLYNSTFLQAQQNYANDILNGRGHLFLNDVLDMLGIDRTPAGAVTGWLKGGNGDGYVDFGILRDGRLYQGIRFVSGDEKSVWLEFNVDGPIFRDI